MANTRKPKRRYALPVLSTASQVDLVVRGKSSGWHRPATILSFREWATRPDHKPLSCGVDNPPHWRMSLTAATLQKRGGSESQYRDGLREERVLRPRSPSQEKGPIAGNVKRWGQGAAFAVRRQTPVRHPTGSGITVRPAQL